jgi:hypothetical protein
MSEEPKQEDTVTQGNQEKANRGGAVKGFFHDNPTFVLTLLYLYATAIGIIYSSVLYGRFGINIFDYSEIADFLLAAFKNPVALVAAGVLVVMGVALAAFAAILEQRIMRRTMRDFGAESRELEQKYRDEYKQIQKQPDEEAQKQNERLLEEIMLSNLYMRRELYQTDHWVKSRRRAIILTATILSLTGICFALVLPYYFADIAASSIKKGETQAVDVRYRSFSGSAGQVTEPNLNLIGATQKAVFFYDVSDKRTIVIPQAQVVSIEVPE